MITREFYEKVKEMCEGFESHRWGNSAGIIAFVKYLKSKVKPEYPCPVCGEEMRVIVQATEQSVGFFYGECYHPHVPIRTLKYSSKKELSKALQERE